LGVADHHPVDTLNADALRSSADAIHQGHLQTVASNSYEVERAVIETELRRRDLTPRLRERLEMVKGIALGQDAATIAAWSGRSLVRIRHWLARYTEAGITALADAPRSGRPPKADAA